MEKVVAISSMWSWFIYFRYETMLLCWCESPGRRPNFANLVKCLCDVIKRVEDQTPYYNIQDGTVSLPA